MPNVPAPKFNPYSRGPDGRGIQERTYRLSRHRLNAPGQFELSWKDKIYLRRIRSGQSMAAVAKALDTNVGTISASLRRAARRFAVEDYKELLALETVQTILDGED